MSVVVVGLNHRTVPIELLERMTVPAASLPKALADVRSREFVSEAVVLSTCHRTEVYGVAERFHGAMQELRNFFGDLAHAPPEEYADHLYTYHDEAAVAHLFGVAAGLDSVVVGESEILGQVREAWTRAADEGATGSRLSVLFRHAVQVGKRARAETGIARHVTSVSQAAVALAAEHLGSLAGRRVLVVGAGDMGEGMAVALGGAAGVELLVANRSAERADALVRRTGGRAVGWSDVTAAVHDVDVVLTSTGAPTILLTADDLGPVVARRGGRPLLVVDVAMPRDVDPAVASLPGVTLLGLQELRTFAEAGLDQRRKEIARVQTIIAEEVHRYLEGASAREMAPTIAALRAHADDVRLAELARYRRRLAGLDDRERAAVEALTRGIMAKLLHSPTVRLKDAAGSARGERLADALRELFEI